jgi:ATP-binding cassette subfamily F protein uup
LDEPTNDLDMETLDMLEEIISQYKGTLLVVSHDRDFLDQTVTKILAFEGNGEIDSVIGGYSDYLASRRKKKKKRNARPYPLLRNQTARVTRSRTPASAGTGRAQKEKTYLRVAIRTGQFARTRSTCCKNASLELENLLEDADLFAKDPNRFTNTINDLQKARNELSSAETRWLELGAL